MSGRSWLLAATVLVSVAPRLPAQDPFALPADARQVLEWHRTLLAEGDDWESYGHRFLAYYQCGAVRQARGAVAAMLARDPSNPDALRYQLHLDAREPARQAQALVDCSSWLRQFRDYPMPEDRVAEVSLLGEALRREQERGEQVAAAARRARLLPWLCLGLCGAFSLLLARKRP